jgi:hypothetical protein
MISMPTTPTPDKKEMKWAVPQELQIPPDPIRIRLDFHHQAVEMTDFEGEFVTTKVVSAYDIAVTLANEMQIHTGLLPEKTLWWRNTRRGPVIAIYEEPNIHKVAIETEPGKPAKRFTIPLPGLVFLCTASTPPWVYAVKSKPAKETDLVYKAPLLNIYNTGRSCGGSHQYSERVQDIIDEFFKSFFSKAADVQGRSVSHPENIFGLWKQLNNKKVFPIEDLVQHGTIQDLMSMDMD